MKSATKIVISHRCLIKIYEPSPVQIHRYPLVLIHGMWGDERYLSNYVTKAVTEGWMVITLTLPYHHGEHVLTAEFGRLSINDLTDSVQHALSDLPETKGGCSIIGHSMGGLVTQKLLERISWLPLVRSACLLCSAFPKGILALAPYLTLRLALAPQYLYAMLRSQAFYLKPVDELLLIKNCMPQASIDRLHFTRPASGRVAWEIATGRIAINEKRVTVPLCVVGATLDRITPYNGQRKLAEKYDCTFIAAKGHGHMVMMEPGWEKIASSLFEWLEVSSLTAE